MSNRIEENHMREQIAKLIAFAGRDPRDVSPDAEVFWAHTHDDNRARFMRQARALEVAGYASPAALASANAEIERLQAVAVAGGDLIADVRSRYPGEALRCPHMIALDAALTQWKEAQS